MGDTRSSRSSELKFNVKLESRGMEDALVVWCQKDARRIDRAAHSHKFIEEGITAPQLSSR